MQNDWITKFREYTKDVESPEKFISWAAVSVISAALERKTWIRFNKYWVFPNMYMMLIGQAGLAKKSSSSGVAIDLLRQVEGIGFLPTQMTASSLVLDLADISERKNFAYNNDMFKMGAGYLYSSEARVTLAEISGSIIELLTDFYDCKPEGWSRTVAWNKSTKIDGNIKVWNPCLSMLACSTPEWLLKTIGVDEIRGGFASRILFVVQKGKPEKAVYWNEESGTSHDKLASELVEDLKAINQMSGAFKVTDDFREACNRFKDRNEKWLEENPNDILTGYYSRKIWHLLKLSQVLSASESRDMIVTAEHWNRALKMLEDIELGMREAFGNTGLNKTYKGLHNLWEYMRAQNTITYAKLLAKFIKDIDRKTLEEHLGFLLSIYKIELIAGRAPSYRIIDKSPLD